jgi:hypothetical protein
MFLYIRKTPVDHGVSLPYNQHMKPLPSPPGKQEAYPVLDPIALATIAGTIIAWIMLIASFSDTAYSMLRRLDEAVRVARTGAANISLDEILSKSTTAKRLISLYFILGAIVAPAMVLVYTLFWRSSKRNSE